MSRLMRDPCEVASEEVERITQEYRRGGFARKAPAVVVYHDPHVLCPWLDCNLRITGIDFQLERQGDEASYVRLLEAWWQGPGLVGKCPECGRHVLYTLQEKQAVADPITLEGARLPEDWAKRSQVVPRVET